MEEHTSPPPAPAEPRSPPEQPTEMTAAAPAVAESPPPVTTMPAPSELSDIAREASPASDAGASLPGLVPVLPAELDTSAPPAIVAASPPAEPAATTTADERALTPAPEVAPTPSPAPSSPMPAAAAAPAPHEAPELITLAAAAPDSTEGKSKSKSKNGAGSGKKAPLRQPVYAVKSCVTQAVRDDLATARRAASPATPAAASASASSVATKSTGKSVRSLDYNDSCEVCGNDLDEIIITCNKCRVKAHPSCYGINPERLPNQGYKGSPIPQWLCVACHQGCKPSCILCGQKGGALKPTEKEGTWGHIDCAIHIPELWFQDQERMDKIMGFEYLPKARGTLTCRICRKQTGYCIQCDFNGKTVKGGKGGERPCSMPFHVMCAKRAKAAGYRIELIYAQSIDPTEVGGYSVAKVAYCPTHQSTVFDEDAWLEVQRAAEATADQEWERLKKNNSKKRKSSTKKKSKTTKAKAEKSSSEVPDDVASSSLDSSLDSSMESLTDERPAKKGRVVRIGDTAFENSQISSSPLRGPLTAPTNPASGSSDKTTASTEDRRYRYHQFCARKHGEEQEVDSTESTVVTSDSTNFPPMEEMMMHRGASFEDLSTLPPFSMDSSSLGSPIIGSLPAMSSGPESPESSRVDRSVTDSAVDHLERMDTSWSSDIDASRTSNSTSDQLRSPQFLAGSSMNTSSSSEFEVLAFVASKALSPRDGLGKPAAGRRTTMSPLPAGINSSRTSFGGSEIISYAGSRRESMGTDAEKENLNLTSWSSSSVPHKPKGDVSSYLRTPSSIKSSSNTTPTQRPGSRGASMEGALNLASQLLSPRPRTPASTTPPPQPISSPAPIPAAIAQQVEVGATNTQAD